MLHVNFWIKWYVTCVANLWPSRRRSMGCHGALKWISLDLNGSKQLYLYCDLYQYSITKTGWTPGWVLPCIFMVRGQSSRTLGLGHEAFFILIFAVWIREKGWRDTASWCRVCLHFQSSDRQPAIMNCIRRFFKYIMWKSWSCEW